MICCLPTPEVVKLHGNICCDFLFQFAPLFLLLYVAAVFRLGLRRIIQLRRECTEMKRYLKEMQLAERNIDATETGLPPLTYLQVVTKE